MDEQDHDDPEEYEYEEPDDCILPAWIAGGIVVGGIAGLAIAGQIQEPDGVGGALGFVVFLQFVLLFFLIGLLHSIRNNVRFIARSTFELRWAEKIKRSRNLKSVAVVIVSSVLLSGIAIAGATACM